MSEASLMRRVAAVLLCLFSAASAFAADRLPARYLVFEIDGNDAVSLLESRRVTMAADRSVPEDARPRVRLHSDEVETSLIGVDGTVIANEVTVLDRYVRGEFTSSPDGAIDGRWMPQERTQFVVRLPAAEASFVEVNVLRTGRTQRLAVSDVDRRARIQSDAAPAAIEVRSDAAHSANRVDLLVLGDGYTAEQRAAFEKDVERVVGTFLSVEPYASYRNYVNVSSIFVPSAQAGADHPLCPTDQSGPKEASFVNTAFDATYCTSGIQRLLTVNNAKVLTAAAAVPDWDKIIVVVNDPMYGGSGGSFSVASMHANAVDILQHEYGHSFGALADEYSTPYPGYPDCSDRGTGSPCEANVTDVMTRESIKWSSWIDASTPIPTLPPSTAVGLFEGARYLTTGMYRPKNSCLMNHLGTPFCEVCSEAYVLKLYRGWNGVPRGGIDLIEPGSEVPAQTKITANAGQQVTFSAELLQPLRGGIDVQWLINGEPLSSSEEARLLFTPPAPGIYVVELRVADSTALVHAAGDDAPLTKSRTWTLTVATQGVPAKRRSLRR